MASEYDKGDQVRVSAAFTNAVGTAIDPTTVRFKYKTPASGTAVTLVYGVDGALVKDSTGNYHVDIDLDLAGVYRFRWESVGTGKAASESFVVVRNSDFD